MTEGVNGHDKLMVAMMAVAWTVVTMAVVMLANRLPGRAGLAAGQWGTLYAVTLLIPAVWTMRLRRRVSRLRSIHRDLPDAVVHELKKAGWHYLLLGYISAVTTVVLVMFYGR